MITKKSLITSKEKTDLLGKSFENVNEIKYFVIFANIARIKKKFLIIFCKKFELK